MLTDEQINDIVQENVWCVEDKTRIIYTVSILKQQNKQLIEALKETKIHIMYDKPISAMNTIDTALQGGEINDR